MDLVASSSSIPIWKYQVFINFRGEDTRETFTSHLRDALRREKIETYIDEENLARGDEISPALLRAIEESMVSVIIFSENYANSSWCLEELVHILKCRRQYGQQVVPVFYKVLPSHVRKQQGSYAIAFKQLQKRRKEKVNSWRAALTEAANLVGWSSHVIRNESMLVEEIVEDILKKLNCMSPSYDDEHLKGLFGIEKHIKQIVEIGKKGVRILGICGMGGIGKTTLAHVLFKKFSCLFEGCCFLSNVREESEKANGLRELKSKLFSELLNRKVHDPDSSFERHRLRHKNVLVVLDDVSSVKQLNILAGDRGDYFGPESKIIVTTRDQRALIDQVNYVYKLDGLNPDDALGLFHWHTFKETSPSPDFNELSKQVVDYAEGNPLALEISGSFFCGKEIEDWEILLKRLKGSNEDEDNIQKILKISYDGLSKDEIVDIARFLKGKSKAFVERLLDVTIIKDLANKSLVTIKLIEYNDIEHNKDDFKPIQMHDLVQEMGLKVVRESTNRDAGKLSWIWNVEDSYSVLHNNIDAENSLEDSHVPSQKEGLDDEDEKDANNSQENSPIEAENEDMYIEDEKTPKNSHENSLVEGEKEYFDKEDEKVEVTPLRPRKEEMAHSSMNGLFLDEIDEVMEEEEKQNEDTKIEEGNETVQASQGLGTELKKLALEFQDFRNEVRVSLASLSFENRVIKEQLGTAIDLLLQFTSYNRTNIKTEKTPPTNETTTQQDHDCIYHGIFGTHPNLDQFCEEGEYEDIKAYSQSKLVTPKSVKCLFGVLEGDKAIEKRLDERKKVEDEEKHELEEKVKEKEKVKEVIEVDIKGKEKGEEIEKEVKGDDEVWLVNLGEDSEPVEVTRSVYLTKNPTKRVQKPNPNVSSGPWTSYGKGRNQRRMIPVLSDVDAPIYAFHAKMFKQWYEKGLERDELNNPFHRVLEFSKEESFTLGHTEVTHKTFFYRIYEPKVWLTCEEMNVIWYYIRHKQHCWPNSTIQRATTTDTYFQSYFFYQWPKFKHMYIEGKKWEVESQLQQYILGATPRLAKHWFEVDYVFFPINVKEYHWCLGMLDLPNWNLLLFDSVRGEEHDAKVLDAVGPVSRMLPSVLDSVGYFAQKKHLLDKKDKPLKICRVQSPKQIHSGDSGIFCCKFAEYIISNKKHKLVDAYMVPKYREKYAVELYTHGHDEQVRKACGHDK